MSNSSLMENFNAALQNTLISNLGIVFTEASTTYVEATMPVDERTSQPSGFLHGGASIALAESVGGAGSHVCMPKGASCFGMQISASHMSAAPVGDTVIAKGTPLHIGRSTHVWNVDVFSKTTNKLVSSVRVTNYIVPPKA